MGEYEKWHLTPKERAVAQSLVRGENPQEACGKLSITRNRYKVHVSHLMQKTGTQNQVELLARLKRAETPW